MVSEAEARRTVNEIVAQWHLGPDPGDEVVVWKVEQPSRAWILHSATRRWLETRDFGDQFVGSCPFVVEKRNGQVHQYGSAPPELAKFEAWLDPTPD